MGVSNYYKEKTAVITGAASGIGREIALQLAAMGTHLVISDINEEGLTKVKEELEQQFPISVYAEVCDVTEIPQVEALYAASTGHFQNIDFLFSNAGIGSNGKYEDYTMAEIHKVININQWGMIHMVNTFLPKFLEQGSGHIIGTASAAGLSGAAYAIPYSVSKFAAVGFCEALNFAYHKQGIHVSVICPYFLQSNLMAGMVQPKPRDIREHWSADQIEQAVNALAPRMIADFNANASDTPAAVRSFLRQIRRKKLWVYKNFLVRAMFRLKGIAPYLAIRIMRPIHETLMERNDYDIHQLRDMLEKGIPDQN